MKAEMDQSGVITLSPETSLEASALRQWENCAVVAVGYFGCTEIKYWRTSLLVIGAQIEGREAAPKRKT